MPLNDPLRIHYSDSSAWAKRYVEEPDSDRVRVLLARVLLATSMITEIEVASALNRRCRDGSITEDERDRALDALVRDLRSLFLVEVTPSVNRRTRALLKRYPLRAADALQLASCLELAEQLHLPACFVVFDSRLREAARGEGLEVAP